MINNQPYLNNNITGKGVVVAVLDSGFEIEHPELSNNVIGTYWAWQKDSNVAETDGHGTSVASVILQISPDVKLLLIKTSFHNDSTFGNANMPLLIDDGIRYATNWRGKNGERVNIINMSFGNKRNDLQTRKLIQDAIKENIIVVASAGNVGDGRAETDELSYPSAYPEVVAVGSHDDKFKVYTYSNSNDEIDLVAPTNIRSAIGKNGYRIFSGTSASAPIVSGTLALLYQKFTVDMGRYPTEAELYAQLIKNTTLKGITGLTDRRMVGNGRLYLEYESLNKPLPENIDIEVVINGLYHAGVIDTPKHWFEFMKYFDSIKPNHPEYSRYRFVKLAFQKFYNHIS